MISDGRERVEKLDIWLGIGVSWPFPTVFVVPLGGAPGGDVGALVVERAAREETRHKRTAKMTREPKIH